MATTFNIADQIARHDFVEGMRSGLLTRIEKRVREELEPTIDEFVKGIATDMAKSIEVNLQSQVDNMSLVDQVKFSFIYNGEEVND